MKTRSKTATLSQAEIDERIVAQADNDSAWEKPIRVRQARSASVPLPSELASRAAFFARLQSVEAWVRRIIQERVELEEAAFAGLKRDLARPPRS